MSMNVEWKYMYFYIQENAVKCRLQNAGHFIWVPMFYLGP